jgi:Icc-related predicted phosphoesterase
MRLAMTSDLHGYLPKPEEMPEADMLLIAGDVTPVWNHSNSFQANWLQTDFRAWLNQLPYEEIVGVAGNHDFIFRNTKKHHDWLPWFYLQNNEVTTMQLKIWGSPYSNKFNDWAFMREERELVEIWDTIPRDIDILIVHGPPYGFGDVVGKVWRDGWTDHHVGSSSLANQLHYDEWPHLKLVVFGHIHEGYGEYENKSVRYLNVSRVDGEYRPINPIMTVDI